MEYFSKTRADYGVLAPIPRLAFGNRVPGGELRTRPHKTRACRCIH